MCSNLWKLGVGAIALTAMGSVGRSASVVNLSVLVNPGNHTWQAFADVEDAGSAGLKNIQFDVTSSGGITLGTTQGAGAVSFNDLPVGQLATGSRSSVPAGFYLFNSSADISSTDLQFQGGQTGQMVLGQNAAHSNIVLGFGKPGQSGNLAGDSTTFVPWSFPAIIADGMYSGSSGSISISGVPAGIALLPDAATVTSLAIFNSHSPDTVNGGTTAVPEPASIGFFSLAAIACLRKRRPS